MAEEFDRIAQFFTDRGVSVSCPLCRNQLWSIMHNAGEEFVIATNSQRKEATSSEEVYVVVCNNCGFIRQHWKPVVDGKQKLDIAFEGE